MSRAAAFLGVVAAAAACFVLGHRAAQRVPIGGNPSGGLWGHRCPACGKAMDPEYVSDPKFYRKHSA